MSLQVVAFDVDGTLYPNSAMYLASAISAIRHFSTLRTFARVRREIREIRPITDFRRTQTELFSRISGIDTETSERLIRNHIYGEWERIIRKVRPYPFVRETLEALKSSGLKLAVLSDFPVGRKLEFLGLDGLWDFVRTSEDSGYLKPCPEPFLDLARFFGADPESVLFVGNSLEYDIRGAGAVGMRTAHLTRRKSPRPEADFSFIDYRDLRNWILSRP